MAVGPVLIYDKSFLQSLKAEEALLLHKLFTINITPVLFLEVIANLEEESKHKNKTPQQFVSYMSDKLPITNYNINAGYDILIESELIKNNSISMDRYTIEAANPVFVNSSDGKKGLYFGESEAEKAIHSWRRGEFSTLDNFCAALWKKNQKNFNLNQFASELRNLLTSVPNFTDLKSVKLYAQKILDDSSINQPFHQLELIAKRFFDDEKTVNSFLNRYRITCEIENKFIHPADFIPYSYYIYLVEFTYILAISKGLIDTHKKSKSNIDLQYLFYLPFCMSFVSNDNTHEKLVPVFKAENQSYVKGSELKDDLKKILTRINNLSEEEKEKYPENHPSITGDGAVSKIYDYHSTTWRKKAEKPIKLTSEQERKILEEFNLQMEAAKNGTPAGFSSLSNGCDFVLKERKMTAAQMKKEFNLSDEQVREIIKNQIEN